MAYKIIVSPRAQKEIENAIDYYLLYSADDSINYITLLQYHFSYKSILIIAELFEVKIPAISNI